MFFEPSSFSERKLSMDYFREWAGQIANSYVTSGAPPTSGLLKIASQEDLTPHQVEVLAAETNKEIHRIKYASAKDKYFAADFPLADAKVAIAALQADGGDEKVARQMPAPKVSAEGPDAYAMFGVKPQALDKTASLRHQLKAASEKTVLLDQKLSDAAILNKFACDAAENAFIKEARQVVLGGDDSAARMQLLGTLDHFVKSSGITLGRRPLAKLAYALGKEGLLGQRHAELALDHLTKKADCKAPQEMISEWLPAKVVNGTHPLYITLQTFRDRTEAGDQMAQSGKLIQDNLKVIRQKVRAL